LAPTNIWLPARSNAADVMQAPVIVVPSMPTWSATAADHGGPVGAYRGRRRHKIRVVARPGR
jgi:hypothetical protein